MVQLWSQSQSSKTAWKNVTCDLVPFVGSTWYLTVHVVGKKGHWKSTRSITRYLGLSQKITRQFCLENFRCRAARDAPGLRTPPPNPVTLISRTRPPKRVIHQVSSPPTLSTQHYSILLLLHHVLVNELVVYPLLGYSKLLDQELSRDDGLPYYQPNIAQHSVAYSSTTKASCTNWPKADPYCNAATMLEGC